MKLINPRYKVNKIKYEIMHHVSSRIELSKGQEGYLHPEEEIYETNEVEDLRMTGHF